MYRAIAQQVWFVNTSKPDKAHLWKQSIRLLCIYEVNVLIIVIELCVREGNTK